MKQRIDAWSDLTELLSLVPEPIFKLIRFVDAVVLAGLTITAGVSLYLDPAKDFIAAGAVYGLICLLLFNGLFLLPLFQKYLINFLGTAGYMFILVLDAVVVITGIVISAVNSDSAYFVVFTPIAVGMLIIVHDLDNHVKVLRQRGKYEIE
jgi:hypothetical protein